jgi:hypothetical protein
LTNFKDFFLDNLYFYHKKKLLIALADVLVILKRNQPSLTLLIKSKKNKNNFTFGCLREAKTTHFQPWCVCKSSTNLS